ncbi:MAG: NUDIX domain-containing protein [Thermoplasmata archaeon]
MIIEKPSNEELKNLIEKYGTPVLTEREVHTDDVTYKNDYLECKGEGVIKIIKDDKIAGVKHTGGKVYVLPQGRIRKDEKFDEGIKREALEESGFDIKLTALKEVNGTDQIS